MGVTLVGAWNFFQRGRLIPDDVLRNEGFLLVQRIQTRTRSGVSSTGARFQPYTKAYAKRKGVSPGRVTLSASGDMLDDIQVLKVSTRRGQGTLTIGFRDGALAARAGYNEVRRPFTEPDPRWIDQMVKGVAASLDLLS